MKITLSALGFVLLEWCSFDKYSVCQHLCEKKAIVFCTFGCFQLKTDKLCEFYGKNRLFGPIMKSDNIDTIRLSIEWGMFYVWVRGPEAF